MKWVTVIMLLVFLAGCSSAPVWEQIDDVLPQDLAAASKANAYEISLALPEQAQTVWEHGNERLYELSNMDVLTLRFQAMDLNAAVRQISGFGAEKLNILQTTRFDCPEYQFTWFTQTEEGGRLHRADLIMDGMTCYAVVCSSPEEAGESFGREAQAVLSTFGLSEPETV